MLEYSLQGTGSDGQAVLFRMDVRRPRLEDVTDAWSEHATGCIIFKGRVDLLGHVTKRGILIRPEMKRRYGKQYCDGKGRC